MFYLFFIQNSTLLEYGHSPLPVPLYDQSHPLHASSRQENRPVCYLFCNKPVFSVTSNFWYSKYAWSFLELPSIWKSAIVLFCFVQRPLIGWVNPVWRFSSPWLCWLGPLSSPPGFCSWPVFQSVNLGFWNSYSWRFGRLARVFFCSFSCQFFHVNLEGCIYRNSAWSFIYHYSPVFFHNTW